MVTYFPGSFDRLKQKIISTISLFESHSKTKCVYFPLKPISKANYYFSVY